MLHIFTAVVLWKSAAPLIVILMGFVFLTACLFYSFNQGAPFSKYAQLSFNREYWLLKPVIGESIKYKRLSIRVDAGFFVLIVLNEEKISKTLIIFRDQVSAVDYRMLRLIERVQ